MVSSSGGCPGCNEPVEQPPLRRQPLKRRSLSQFYYSKSQSFNCIQDLVKDSAFSRSALLLAKRVSQSQKQTSAVCSSIFEDHSEPTSSQSTGSALAAVQPSPFVGCSLQRYSWDGSQSGNPQPPAASCCLFSSLSATPEQQDQHKPQEQDLHCAAAQREWQSQPLSADYVAWRLPLGADADHAMEDCRANGWSESNSLATDSLCAALQTAKLTAPQGLLGMAKYTMGFSTADHHNLVMVGAAASTM